MKKLLFYFFILSAGSLLAEHDSTNIQCPHKNIIYGELLGKNYVSPYQGSSPFSLNYSRVIIEDAFCLQLSVGGSFYETRWDTWESNHWDYHKKSNFSMPASVLFRFNYKRNGLWAGLSLTSAFGRQIYFVSKGKTGFERSTCYDPQLCPNISYQFRSRDQKFFFQLSTSSKILMMLNKADITFPLYGIVWFGLSIGGAW